MFANSDNIITIRKPDQFREFLVFIRCGSNPRPSLFTGPLSDERNFDVAVNYYAEPHPDDFFRNDAELLIAGGLSKYHAAKLALHQGLLEHYEGVLFLDEDIELHFEPSDFFAYCRDKRFAIAQAALSHASDGAWRITFYHPGFEYRLTNFVEVMAPYFNRNFLLAVAERFDMSISTYGLDVFWGSQLESDQQAAVVDRFIMSHMKRRDFTTGSYYAYLRSRGIDCYAELKAVLRMLGLTSYAIRSKGGVEIVESVRVA